MSALQERIISLEQVAEETPWSKSTLYRVAPQEDSPFRKVKGRWVTTEEDLKAWVRAGAKPRPKAIGNPMPRPRRRSSFAALVNSYEGAA